MDYRGTLRHIAFLRYQVADYRPHAPRGNAVRDALRHKSALHRIVKIGCGASQSALATQCLELLDHCRS
ncbi:DUF1534 domain-containing protein [Pseudomonas congelans]|nr:DUF1534 domain-containing protein [Pseudomonas congelans]